jgi:hypothetical protein
MIIQLRCVTMWTMVTVVAVVVLIATYVTWTAARVDRLHARAAAAAAALDACLVKRAEAAVALGERRGLPDLQAVSKAALAAQPGERELAENDLTRALRTVADPPEELVESSRRVALARQVHTDLARDARALRRRRLVRLLGLTRRHPEPRFFDIDEPELDTGL